MCHALGLVDKVHGPFTLAGVETGNQCFCDSEKNPAYPLGTKREPETDCNTPCAGKPSEMCGGGSRVEILRINCGSNWGWFFILTVFLCTLGYVGGFAGYNHKVKGVPLSQEALPHQEQWMAIRSLVEDGVRWSAAELQRARGGRGQGPAAAGAGYTSLAEAAEAKAAAEPGKPALETVVENESGSDDDSLVE